MKPTRRELFTRFGPAAALLWPLLQASRASAQQTAPKRFITFFSSSGVMQSAFWPTGAVGNVGAYSVDGRSLEPLKTLLPDLIIPKGITIDRGGGDAHNAGSVAILTGNYLRDPSSEAAPPPYAKGESLDYYLQSRLSAGRPLACLRVGVRLQINRISKWISYNPNGGLLDYAQDPYSVYNQVFKSLVNSCAGMTTSQTQQIDKQIFRRRSVLDVLKVQSDELKRSVGLDSAERQKVERMEESIRSVERRLESTMTPTTPTTNPRCVSVKTTMESTTKVVNSDAKFPELLKLQMDLIALALELDITRVVTLSLSLGGSGGAPMNWLKWNNNGTMQPIDASHHNVTHGLQRGVANYREKLAVIDIWNMAQFGYLASALKSISEGEHNVLHNSILWYASDVGEGNPHSTTNMPFLIAGRAGGTIQSGRYMQFNAVKHPRLLLTFLHKLGFNSMTSWGRAGASDGGDLF